MSHTYHVWLRGGQTVIIEKVEDSFSGKDTRLSLDWVGKDSNALILMRARPKHKPFRNWKPVAVFLWDEIAGFAMYEEAAND
jgi:hypothetical protein